MNLVNATGKGGRILKEDILKFLNISSEDSNDVQKMKNAEKVDVPKFETPIKQRVPEKQPLGEDKTVPVSGYTKVMVRTMTAALVIIILENICIHLLKSIFISMIFYFLYCRKYLILCIAMKLI